MGGDRGEPHTHTKKLFLDIIFNWYSSFFTAFGTKYES